jgi:integrase
VRGAGKSSTYRSGSDSNCTRLQEFVDSFGPCRLLREVTETDLPEYYQHHCKSVAASSAGTYIGQLLGMLKCAGETRPDLVNWLRPKVKTSKKNQYDRRAFEQEEYDTLVSALLNPPRPKCREIYREAADAVRILRNTGARLNEGLRLRLSQLNHAKRTVHLYASKTERERDVPLTDSVCRIVQARIREGLADAEYLFAGACVDRFDAQIADLVRRVAVASGLDYGQKRGLTLHSLRHAYITHLLANGVDAPTVMEYSGHKSYESFSLYLHKTDLGEKRARLILGNVDGLLTDRESEENVQNDSNETASPAKALRMK